jgi:hypothetical protein
MHRMHVLMMGMVALLFASGVSDVSSATIEATADAASENPLYRPEDPTTLRLALIGGGTLAVYFACRRTVRARPATTMPVDVDLAADATLPKPGEPAEERSRGAA